MKPRILLVPGIGDIHWVMLKMQSFIEINELETPEIWIWNFDNRPRGLEFIERIPFVTPGGYWDGPVEGKNKKTFNAMYNNGEYDILKNFEDFDYLICPNGSLRFKESFERDIMPEYKCNWEYPLSVTDEELNYMADNLEAGPYILLFFSRFGMFRQWLTRWGPKAIRTYLDYIHRMLPKHRLILTGSEWDVNLNDELSGMCGNHIENLAGKTSLSQLLGLIRGASAFTGWCGGNTIISSYLGAKTYILWSDFFRPCMSYNWASPKSLNNNYIFDDISQIGPDMAATRLISLIMEGVNDR